MPITSKILVGVAMLASWVVAIVFTPYLGLKLLPDCGLSVRLVTLA